MTLQNISRVDFCDVVSVLPCSPTNKGKQNIFDAVRKKLIDREKSRSPSWLFDCHRCWARNIIKAAACELIGAKTGRNFQFNLFFLSHSAYITFRIIMSFRKPCHMPFRKPIPPFTLTDWLFEKHKRCQSIKAIAKWNERNVQWIWMHKKCTFYVQNSVSKSKKCF